MAKNPVVIFLFLLNSFRTAASFLTTIAKSAGIHLTQRIPPSSLLQLVSKPTLATGLFGQNELSAFDENVPDLAVFTDCLTSKSGLPVCKYALGGAARSTQPTSLVHDYCETVMGWFENEGSLRMAPFLFYYNPNRYPDFMKGIQQASVGDSKVDIRREDLFLASGGTDRSNEGMEERLSDALDYAGGEYLDMFVLEYVCPDEVEDDPESVLSALDKARSWVDDGRVRYVAASTHSHRVGAWLGSLQSLSTNDSEDSDRMDATILDAMMLRYNMAHKSAAENISFPACAKAGIPVVGFTTTRWNRLQAGHPNWPNKDDEISRRNPTTSECLSFALSSSSSINREPWPIQVVLHSARTADELEEAMACLSQSTSMTEKDAAVWREYGDLEWNDLDGFDEYPEERTEER